MYRQLRQRGGLEATDRRFRELPPPDGFPEAADGRGLKNGYAPGMPDKQKPCRLCGKQWAIRGGRTCESCLSAMGRRERTHREIIEIVEIG